MLNWKFWKKVRLESPVPHNAPEPTRRFSAKPRTDLAGVNTLLGTELVEKLRKLQRRREAVLFDVEQANLAALPENPWRERVKLLDDALAAVRADRDIARETSEAPGQTVIPAPITALTVSQGPPPAVSFDLMGEHFHYEEEIDWAERGFQLARGDLQLLTGNPDKLVPKLPGSEDPARLREHLTASLFVFASDLRDRYLAGEVLPTVVPLTDLARPDLDAGGWFDWKGHSAAAARKDHQLALLHDEEQRLLDERERELREEARWADRLPIARRRLMDVDAEIAALGV